MSELRPCRFCGAEATIGEAEIGASVAYCRGQECPVEPRIDVGWDHAGGDAARDAMRPVLTRMWNAAMGADLSAKAP